jgi:DNA-binding MarR family transcriptional regulator
MTERSETRRVGQLLAVAARAAETLATEALEPFGLTPRGWGVLSTLVESGPLAQSRLGQATATDRTVMVYLLDELERRRLVRRARNPDDRRSFLVDLTPKGRELQGRAAAVLAERSATLLAPLTAGERDELVDLLQRLAAHWEAQQPAAT